jgi:CheY-like chemotaxis protein
MMGTRKIRNEHLHRDSRWGRAIKRLRVLLAHDHGVVREGLTASSAASPCPRSFGEAADGEEALRQIEALRPDVTVVDIAMPRMTSSSLPRRDRPAAQRDAEVHNQGRLLDPSQTGIAIPDD